MRKIYNIYILIVVVLFVSYNLYIYHSTQETFVPKMLKEKYRPYVRYISTTYQGWTITNGFNQLMNKLRKWGVY